MTTTSAPQFHQPAHSTGRTEFAIMSLRNGSWRLDDPTMGPTGSRADAQAHLDTIIEQHQAAIAAYERDLANTPAHDTAEIAWITKVIERERAIEYALFTRPVGAFTRA